MIAQPPSRGAVPFPTIICSWCKQVLRIGAPQVSHGICHPCAAIFFGRNLPEPIVLPA